jgi:hypothetical protein
MSPLSALPGRVGDRQCKLVGKMCSGSMLLLLTLRRIYKISTRQWKARTPHALGSRLYMLYRSQPLLRPNYHFRSNDNE